MTISTKNPAEKASCEVSLDNSKLVVLSDIRFIDDQKVIPMASAKNSLLISSLVLRKNTTIPINRLVRLMNTNNNNKPSGLMTILMNKP